MHYMLQDLRNQKMTSKDQVKWKLLKLQGQKMYLNKEIVLKLLELKKINQLYNL